MGELGDRARGDGEVIAVVEGAQRDRCGAHQRTVAGGAGVGRGVRGCLLRHDAARALLAPCQATGGRTEHRRGLDADVGRAIGKPGEESFGDAVQGGLRRQVGTGGGHAGDGHGHRRVVAPLPRREVAESAAAHLGVDAGGRRRGELVRHAEGVAGGRAEDDAGGAV